MTAAEPQGERPPLPALAQLLQIVDRAERSLATAGEYTQLRDGLRALARSANRERMAYAHAHRADADRAETAATAARHKAEIAMAEARRARAFADGYALAATGQRPDTTIPDGAWGSVWLHADWRWLTRQMTTEEREHAAAAVARWSAAIDADDPDVGPMDDGDLRWWNA